MWTAFQEIQLQQYFKEQYTDPWNAAYPSTPLTVVAKPTTTLAQLEQTALGTGHVNETDALR